MKGALYDIISIVGSLRQYYTDLINLFIPVQNKADTREYEILLEDEIEKKFYETLSNFGRHLKLALESEEFTIP